MTIQQLQAFVDTNPDTRQLINVVVDYLQANPSGGGSPGGSSYLVYAALLTQSGTDDPVAIVLQNTIGAIVWTRSGPGVYVGTLTGAFTVGKVALFITPNDGAFSGGFFYMTSGGVNDVTIGTGMVATGSEDGWLANTTIKIEVYP